MDGGLYRYRRAWEANTWRECSRKSAARKQRCLGGSWLEHYKVRMYPHWYRANGEGELDLTMRLVEDIAERLGEMPGVAAVVLGGLQARGEAHPNSVKRLLASPKEP
jgi:hypothetical protein